MKDLSKKISEKIESQNIKPRSKIIFWLRDILLSFVFLISLSLASLGASLVYFVLVNNTLLGSVATTILLFIFTSALCSSVFLAIFFGKKIKNNYRKSFLKLFIIIISLLFVSSSLFIGFKIHDFVDRRLASFAPQIAVRKNIEKNLHDEKRGRVTGSLLEITDEGIMLFEDIKMGRQIVDPIYLDDRSRDVIVRYHKVIMSGYFSEEIFYPVVAIPFELKGGRENFIKKLQKKTHRGNIDFMER